MPRRYVYVPEEPTKRLKPKGKPSGAEGLFARPAEIPRAETKITPKPTSPKPEAVVASEATPEPGPTIQVPTPPTPPAPVPTWAVQARQVDLLTVARHVGVEVVCDEEGGHRIAPCPRCGSAEGVAVFVNPRWNVRQWRCPTCKGRGGNLDLAALTL